MKTNFLSFIFIWCVVQVTSDFPEELIEDFVRECFEELKLDKSILSKIFDERLRLTDLDEDGKKFVECGTKKGEVFSDDGTMNRDVLFKHIVKSMRILGKGDSEKEAEEIYEKCHDDNKGEENIERIKHFSICVSEGIEKL